MSKPLNVPMCGMLWPHKISSGGKENLSNCQHTFMYMVIQSWPYQGKAAETY